MSRVSDRDERFREFFDAEIEALRRFAVRLTGDWSEAEDLAQEAMLRTYRAWDRIRERERPGLYARAIVVNRHRSMLRRALVEAKHLVARSADATAPEGLRDDARVVWDEVVSLPPRQRAAIVLRYYEDLPQGEIARVLRCAPGTVGSLLHRGLARLRARLEEETVVRSQA